MILRAQYFTPKTDPALFTCPCGSATCGAPAPTSSLLSRLDALREMFGGPVTVTSGVRCLEHNRAVGGASDSEHVSGQAADLLAVDSATLYRLVAAAVRVGIERIGVYQRHVHVDVSATHARPCLWVVLAE